MMYHIILGKNHTELEMTAALLVASRVQDRTSLKIEIIVEGSSVEDEFAIIAGTPESSEQIRLLKLLPADIGYEGYMIKWEPDRRLCYVVGMKPAGVLFGLGKLLHRSGFCDGEWLPKMEDHIENPIMPVRGIYFATHFGNWYCKAELRDLETYIEDLALWGYNHLDMWFDFHHYHNLEEGEVMWNRLEALDSFARKVGMSIGRGVLTNEGFRGQAGEGKQIYQYPDVPSVPFGASNRIHSGYDTDLCPSHPEGKRLILENRKLFLQKKEHLDFMCLGPYDQGGCNCEKCTPWPRTFMEMNRELVSLLKQYHPGAEPWVCSWWISRYRPEEESVFFEELDKREGWFRYIIAGEVELRKWKLHNRILPDLYSFVLFPEISMFDAFPWGSKGANPTPTKIVAECNEFKEWLSGAIPYSEGRYEDYNKVMWAGVLWNLDRPADEIIWEYCNYYFGIQDPNGGVEFISEVEKQVLYDMNKNKNPHADLVAVPYRTGEPKSPSVIDYQAEQLENEMPAWACESWRWKLLRSRTVMARLLNELEQDDISSDERRKRIKELKDIYEYLEHTIYLHDREQTESPLLYDPFDVVYKKFLELYD